MSARASERASRLSFICINRERKRQMTNLENKRAGATMHFHCNASAATPASFIALHSLCRQTHLLSTRECGMHISKFIQNLSIVCLSIPNISLSLHHMSVFMVCYNSSKNNGHGFAGGGWCVLAV